MIVASTIEETRLAVAEAKAAGRCVALAPTMGALHEGHLSLIDAARRACDFVVVSIFVNPTQFGPSEDLAAYPRGLDADLAACEARGVDLVFTPAVETMYPDGGRTTVTVAKLPETLCGRSRPTHFAGVCTVVAKLLNIVQPDQAMFGVKDYQQATILRQMVSDLDIPVGIVVCPIVREADGVAMSSRNANLSEAERAQAPALHESLRLAERMIRESAPPAGDVIAAIQQHLAERAPDGEIDYVQIIDPDDLSDVENTDRPVVVALAVQFARARLIDNVRVDASGSNS